MGEGRGEGRQEPLYVSGSIVAWRFQRFQNPLKHSVQVLKNIVVGEANHLESKSLKRPLALNVVRTAVIMTRPVEFDDQEPLSTQEIDDVVIDWGLSNKLMTGQPTGSEPGPQQSFGIREVSAELSGELQLV